jgi:hypothetical protein
MEGIILVPLHWENSVLSFAIGEGGPNPSAFMLAEINVLFSEACKELAASFHLLFILL